MSRGAYYNENDPNAAAWLRALIAEGHIAKGEVDERDIRDVTPNDLVGFTQHHFFAGIGGWSVALRLAGWPDDKPVWTGSCPCQPFSAAGKGNGFADERHLWPYWFWLIEQCQPQRIFGEQVASKAALDWLDLVSSDLEATGYAVGAVDIPACGVGAPHIRNRLWWVADSNGGDASAERQQRSGQHGQLAQDGSAGELADSGGARRGTGPSACAMEHSAREQVGLPGRPRLEGTTHWSACDWLPCIDGKTRPVEPGTFPLAYGLPARVGRLRGYGNAIVPQVAAQMILAYESR